jgi:hypothetical protein
LADNVKMDLKGIGCEDVEWAYLAQARLQWLSLVDMMIIISVP